MLITKIWGLNLKLDEQVKIRGFWKEEEEEDGEKIKNCKFEIYIIANPHKIIATA